LKKTQYENILFKQRKAAEILIDELLNNLVILYKKKIYYDGYNNSSKIINYDKVLPYNILFEPDYKTGINPYNIQNLLFF
jgi:hypothetical protein